MFLISAESLLKIEAAESSKVPDSWGIFSTGAEVDLRLYALTQRSDSFRYSGKESSCKALYTNFKMLKSILLLILSQFKVGRSSSLANLLKTKPAHAFLRCCNLFCWFY